MSYGKLNITNYCSLSDKKQFNKINSSDNGDDDNRKYAAENIINSKKISEYKNKFHDIANSSRRNFLKMMINFHEKEIRINPLFDSENKNHENCEKNSIDIENDSDLSSLESHNSDNINNIRMEQNESRHNFTIAKENQMINSINGKRYWNFEPVKYHIFGGIRNGKFQDVE